MSGGSLSYLYNKQFPDVCNYIGEMKKVEKELISQGYTDIAKDVRRLIQYCLTAENRISVLFDNLSDVFHAVEWYYSSDYDEKDMLEVLDEYRKDTAEEKSFKDACDGGTSDETVIISGDAFLKKLAEVVKEADALRTKCPKEGIDTEKFHKGFESYRKLCFKISEDFYHEEIKNLLERKSNL